MNTFLSARCVIRRRKRRGRSGGRLVATERWGGGCWGGGGGGAQGGPAPWGVEKFREGKTSGGAFFVREELKRLIDAGGADWGGAFQPRGAGEGGGGKRETGSTRTRELRQKN